MKETFNILCLSHNDLLSLVYFEKLGKEEQFLILEKFQIYKLSPQSVIALIDLRKDFSSK